MRIILTFIVLVFVTTLKAQTLYPGNFQNETYGSMFAPDNNAYDSSIQKKWFISSYTGITPGYSFFNHGNAGFVAVSTGLQLNHRLNNNIYAFAGVIAAPMYINFNRAFLSTDLNTVKTGGGLYQSNNFSLYSAATFGLMYINNEKTFSVSGSISVEKSSYPLYYNNRLNTTKATNTMPSYR